MQKINTAAALRDAIVQLEIEHAEEGKVLKQQFHLAYESIKPLNLLKSTFKEAAASQDLKDNIVNTSVGLAAGYLSKLLFVNVSHNPIRKLLGIALQFGITKLVATNPETVKSMGKSAMKIIKSKLSSKVINEQQAS
jgi:hypothetical protein